MWFSEACCFWAALLDKPGASASHIISQACFNKAEFNLSSASKLL